MAAARRSSEVRLTIAQEAITLDVRFLFVIVLYTHIQHSSVGTTPRDRPAHPYPVCLRRGDALWSPCRLLRKRGWSYGNDV